MTKKKYPKKKYPLYSAAELLEMKFPIPKNAGPWTFDTEQVVVVHERGYEVDIEQCSTSGKTLDGIAQVAGKPWCTDEALGQLVRLLDRLLGIQGSLCPGGSERSINDVRSHLVRRIAQDGMGDDEK